MVLATAVAGCATSGFPWPASGPLVSATRKDVATINPSYRRSMSQVLVRRVSPPTRASLDYAAYHANFMNADPPPEGAPAAEKSKRPNVKNPFGGALVPSSLTGSVARTALSPEERAHPLALPPLVELLVSRKIAGSDRLEDIVARVRAVLRRSAPHRTAATVSASPEPLAFVPREAVREARVLVVDDLQLYSDRHEVYVRGELVELTRQEFRLLEELLQGAGMLLSRQTLLERIWGPEFAGNRKVLSTLIGRLRARIEDDPDNPVRIVTIRGLGYRYEHQKRDADKA